MKTIRIDSLLIEYVKGTTRREITPHGRDVKMEGQTGSGKTTIAGACNWLWNNKDADGTTGSELRPKHRDGPQKDEPVRGLVMVVEAKITLDGFGGALNGEWTLRKEEHEHAKKTMLEGRAGFSYSYPKKYFINGDSVQEKAFNAWMARIERPEVVRMLTDRRYFLANEKSGGMHHKERRALLRAMGGNIGTPEGFSDIDKAIKGRELAGYKKEVRDRKKENEASLDKIPTAIGENQLAVDAGSGDKSHLMLKAERVIQVDELVRIAADRTLLLQMEQVRAKAQEKLAGLRASQSERETFLANDMSAVEALTKENETLQLEAASEAEVRFSANEAVHGAERVAAAARANVDTAIQSRENIKRSSAKLNTQESSEPCPAGAECPHAVDDAKDRDAHSEALIAMDGLKKKVLAECKEVAARCDAATEAVVSAKEARDTLLVTQTESTNKREARYAEIAEAIKSRPRVHPADDEEWSRIVAAIMVVGNEIGDPVSEQLAALEEEKLAAEREKNRLTDKLAAFDATEKAKARIVELKAKEKTLAQSILDDEQILRRIELFTQAESVLISKAVNDRFEHIEFRLFKVNLNGGIEECCDPMLHGVSYAGASSGEKMLMQVDAATAVGNYYGLHMPLVLDDRHALTQDLDLECQVIALRIKAGQEELTVQIGGEQ